MVVLVTGGSGEIGRRLVERLLASGRDLRVLTRSSRPPAPSSRCTWVQGDLRDASAVAAALAGVDEVIHAAAVTHTTERTLYAAVNVQGTAHLVDAAAPRGLKRFVHVSTRAIGAAGGGYSHSKERAEARVTASGLPWVVLRPAEVYGGGGHDAVLDLVRTIEQRRFVLVPGHGRWRLSPVHVDDVVEALVRALDAEVAVGQVYTLAGPEELTLVQLVERIEAHLGVPRRVRIHVPLVVARVGVELAALLGRGGVVRDQLPRLTLAKSADSSLAARELGFAPRRLEVGLRAVRG
jgi:NADH dehydrogenase